jgi:hypothetical protein
MIMLMRKSKLATRKATLRTRSYVILSTRRR